MISMTLFSLGMTSAACGASSSSSSGGGSSSSGGSSGGPLVPVTGPVDPNDAVKAAALLGSCIPDDRSNRILRRIYERTGGEIYDVFERSSVACLATKTSGCQGVSECTGVTSDTAADCKPGCEGNLATSCDDSLRFKVDCARLGRQCSLRSTSNTPECTVGTPVACDVNAYVASCQDDKPTYCTGVGVRTGPKCGDVGTTCGETSSPKTFACKGTAGACNAKSISPGSVTYEDGVSCNGATLRACVNGGLKDVDCASLAPGFTCQSAGTSFWCGLGNACAPGSGTKPSCDGTSLVLCNGGRIDKIDCRSLGFTGCNATAGACVPSVWGPG
jgi:hypothetical protein